jgi:hypothetical protein
MIIVIMLIAFTTDCLKPIKANNSTNNKTKSKANSQKPKTPKCRQRAEN